MKILTPMLLLALSLTAEITRADSHLSDEKIAAANALLVRNGIEVDMAITQYLDYGNGGGVVSGVQVHDGLKVFDGQLTYHFGPGGDVVRMPDESVYRMREPQDLDGVVVNRDELISTDAAIETINKEGGRLMIAANLGYQHSASYRVFNCARNNNNLVVELGLIARHAVWHVNCDGSRTAGAFVDAKSGELVELPEVTPTIPVQ
jgi:hypothetical protein